MRPVVVLLTAVCCVSIARGADDGFKPLFDGTSLAGWKGNMDLWNVKDGAIVGKTDGNIPANTFLIHDGEYGDFVLKVKFRLRNHAGNSGVQYRSTLMTSDKGQELPPFVLGGYQADIAADKHMGILYGEKTGRGIIQNLSPELQKQVADALHKDGWNEYVITAKGDHITQVLNGVKTVDINDPEGPKQGVIGLQLHRGHNMEVEYKDILIKTLGAH